MDNKRNKIKLTPKKVNGRIWIPGYYAKVEIEDNEIISASSLKKLSKIFVDIDLLKKMQEDYVMYYVRKKGFYAISKRRKGWFAK